MTSREPPAPETTLEHYPWVVVRFRCMRCRRYADARVARLAEKFGAGETIGALVERFQSSCPNRPTTKNGRRPVSWSHIGVEGCAGYCPDLGSSMPPDLPPSLSGLTLIEGGKQDMLPADPISPERRRRRVGGEDEG